MLIATENWLLIPVGMFIATIAMFTGLGGGVLWMPLLLTVMKIPPREAVLCTLLIQFCGQASASVTNNRQKLVDWRLVRMMAIAGIPLVMLGVIFSSLLHPVWIEFFLGLIIFFIAYVFLRGDDFFEQGGEKADYTAAKKGQPITSLGGILTGFIGIGVGDWLVPFFNKHCKLTMARSVASSIALMMVLSGVALLGHFFLQTTVRWDIAIPGIIGVVAGAQVGSLLLRRMPEIKFKEIFVLLLVFLATHVTFNAL